MKPLSFRRKLTVHVARAERDDIPVLAQIHADAFPHAWDEDAMTSLLNGNGVAALAARLQGERGRAPVGFVIYRSVSEEAEILTIATAAGHRRRGVGRALMEHCIRTLQADRVERLILEVGATNDKALSLYRSLGFKPISRRRGYYRPPVQDAASGRADALVLQLDLG